MSYEDHLEMQKVLKTPFKSLIMAAFRAAPTTKDCKALQEGFPEIVMETIARLNSRDGKLAEDPN